MSRDGSDSGSGTETAVAPPGAVAGFAGTAAPRSGGVLGRYQLIEVLGHGAMATVFRARDTQLSREVAVKVMTLAVAARADSAERFRREARAVAAVKHPGIVEIFDFVAANDADPAYIVSELIKGPTLRKFLEERRGRLLPESAALIAMALAEALQAAHARGVVHRDIKPDNVMLERATEGARVVLTDFGVAQVTGMETMTATGALVGSPSYMSPEQGRGEDVGPASDLFSLGVLLYEMATGVLPFPGRDPLTVLAAIGKGLFKRPSAVSRFAGVGLDEICARCLCVNAAERYADAAALAADLRRYCAEAGLADGAAALRAFLTDPDSFETGLRPRVADAAVATARRHARRGELARALGHLARATAYVPGHAEAEKLIARISSRRAWAKVAAVASGVAIVGFGTWALSPWVRAKLAETGGERAAEQSESVAVAPGNAQGAGATVAREEPRRESDTTAVGAVEAVGTGDNDKARQGKPERNGRTIPLGSASDVSKKSTTSGSTLARDRVGGPAPTRTVAGTMRTGRGATTSPRAKAEESGAGETPGAVAGAGPATTGGTMPAEAIGAPAAEGTNEGAKPEISEGLRPGANDVSPPPATPPEPAVAEGSNANAASPTSAAWIPLHIFVENAFCTPSVDKQKPRRTPARYLVAAGAHQIHCEMPGGHRWSQSLTIATPAGGGPFRVQLRRDSQGRATIDAAATSKAAPAK